MSVNHGVFVSEQATSVSTPTAGTTGIPFVIGASPLQAAEDPATVGAPVLVKTWAEAVKKLGYSDDWASYQLCELMYSQFKLFGAGPVIFCNLLDPATHYSAQAAADKDVADHKIKLPIEAIDSTALVVKAAGGGGSAYVKGTDYTVFYDSEYCIIELKSAGACYSATSLNVAYNKVAPSSVDATAVATGMEHIEECMTAFGVVPDIICAPGFSKSSAVAAVMATKAAGINGLFKAKALIDIDCSASGATTASAAVTAKGTASLTDENEILCWPMVKNGTKKFYLSTQLAGLIAQTDAIYGGIPYASPANHALKCDAICLEAGTELNLTLTQANNLIENGICTGLHSIIGFVAWGSYTACYPGNSDVKDSFIPVSRMFDYVGNTIIKTLWTKLEVPMTRPAIDSILNSVGTWLNYFIGQHYLLGARVEMRPEDNPQANLVAGKIKLHIYITPPSPIQEIDAVLEYDAEYVTAALAV